MRNPFTDEYGLNILGVTCVLAAGAVALPSHPRDLFPERVPSFGPIHRLVACFDTGEDWKAICECSWETWGHRSRDQAISRWRSHAADIIARTTS